MFKSHTKIPYQPRVIDNVAEIDVYPYTDLIAKACAIESIGSSAISDMIKAINLIKFIQINIAWVAYAVEHKNDASIYRFPEDKEKGVLRDRFGTSFHINSYTTKEQVYSTFSKFIAEFSAYIIAVLKAGENPQQCIYKDPIKTFAESFIYPNDVGCLEERMSKPREVALLIITNPLQSINAIMDKIVNTNPVNSIVGALEQAQKYMGMEVLDINGNRIEITTEIIKQYCLEFLNFEDEAIDEAAAANDTIQNFLPAIVDLKQDNDIIKFYFKYEAESKIFINYIRHLLESNASSIEHENDDQYFIVFLTHEQCIKILEKLSDFTFEKLKQKLEENKLTRQSFYKVRAKFIEALILCERVEFKEGVCYVNFKNLNLTTRFYQQFTDLCNSEVDGLTSIKLLPTLTEHGVSLSLELIQRIYPRHPSQLEAAVNFDRSLLDPQSTKLHQAASQPMGKALRALYQMTEADVLSRSMHIPNSTNQTPLFLAARWQQPEDFINFIKIACLFHEQEKMCGKLDEMKLRGEISEEDYQQTIEQYRKIGAYNLNNAVQVGGNNFESSVLLTAIKYQSKNSLLFFMSFLTDQMFEKVIQPTTCNQSVLYNTAQYQQSEVYLYILSRTSDLTLKRILDSKILIDIEKIFEMTLKHQGQKAFLALLERTQKLSIFSSVEFNNFLQKDAHYNSNTFLHFIMLGQPSCVVEKILKLTDGKTLCLINQKAYDEKKPHLLLLYLAASYLETTTFNFFIDTMFSTKEFFLKEMKKTKDYLDLKQQKRFIKSLSRHLKNEAHPFLLDEAQNNVIEKQPLNSAVISVTTEIEDLIQRGNAIVKIVDQKRLEKLVLALKDYEHRPQLRALTSGDYRYNSKKEIIETNTPKKHKVLHDATKKTSCTLLAPNLSTALFQNDEQVGFLFDIRECEIAGMFSNNATTYNKEWLGTYNDVQTYVANNRYMMYSSLDEFRLAVTDKYIANEVMAKLRRGALKAVIINQDTLGALQQAQIYVDTVKNLLGVTLPIYHYDCYARVCNDVTQQITVRGSQPTPAA